MLDNYYARDEEQLWIQLQRFSRRLAASCVCVLQDTSCQKESIQYVMLWLYSWRHVWICILKLN